DAANIVVPPVTITSLTHLVQNSPPYTADSVAFSCGGGVVGTCTSSGFTATILQGDTVQLRFQPPAGQRFHVEYNPAFSTQAILVDAMWRAASDVSGTITPPTVTLENLNGPAPVQLSGAASVGNGGKTITVDWAATVSADVTFTAIIVSFAVANATPGVAAT